MKKYILLLFVISTGLFFNSCKNDSSKNSKTEVHSEDGEKNSEYGKVAELSDFAQQSVDDELAEKVKNYLITEFLTDGDLRAIKEDQRKFQLYKIDLNNDGNDEVFVNFMNSYFCGTGGCTVLLLDSDLELITRLSPTRTLYVEKILENGWSVLFTETEGNWKKLIYKNGTYPSNPTMVETTNELPSDQAQIMFDEESSKLKTYTF